MKTIRLSDDEKFDSLFNRFDKTHECNGQTDRQTDRQMYQWHLHHVTKSKSGAVNT